MTHVRRAVAHLDEIVDEPGSDTCPDHIHKEVTDGKEPGEGVLQALVLQRVHDAGLVLGPRCSTWTHLSIKTAFLS